MPKHLENISVYVGSNYVFVCLQRQSLFPSTNFWKNGALISCELHILLITGSKNILT